MCRSACLVDYFKWGFYQNMNIVWYIALFCCQMFSCFTGISLFAKNCKLMKTHIFHFMQIVLFIKTTFWSLWMLLVYIFEYKSFVRFFKNSKSFVHEVIFYVVHIFTVNLFPLVILWFWKIFLGKCSLFFICFNDQLWEWNKSASIAALLNPQNVLFGCLDNLNPNLIIFADYFLL